jgi:hypothetical protein
MLNNIKINAGLSTEVAKKGRHINVVLAAGEIEVRIRQESGNVLQTRLVSGMSFEVPSGFVSVGFTSDISQQTKVWLSDLPLTYSPLDSKIVGSNAVDSVTRKALYNEVSELVPARSGRAAATIYASSDLFVGGVGLTKANAIKVPANTPYKLSTQGIINAYTDDPTKKAKSVIKLNGTPTVLQQVDVGAALGGLFYSAPLDMVFYRQGGSYKKVSAVDLISGDSTLSNVTSVQHNDVFDYEGYLYVLTYFGLKISIAKIDIETGISQETALGDISSSSLLDWHFDGGKVALINALSTAVELWVGDVDGLTKRTPPITGALKVVRWCADGALVVLSNDYSIRSLDGGVTWQPEVALPVFAMANTSPTVRTDMLTGAMYAAASGVLRKSLDNGATWLDIASFGSVDYLQCSGDVIYITSLSGGIPRLYYSEDGGNSFLTLTDLLTSIITRYIAVASTGALYVGDNNGVITSIGGELAIVGGLDVAVMSEVN